MNIFSSYKKAKAVVLSCDDHSQLDAAKRYVNLFFVNYSSKSKKGNHRVATEVAGELYNKLKSLLYVKKYELTKYID